MLGATVLAGLFKYKIFDAATRVLWILLVLTAISEWIGFAMYNKNPVYHIYAVVCMVLMSVYFLLVIKSRRVVLYSVLYSAAWVLLAVANCYLFQPLHSLNSNILILMSFSIIAMGLFALFKIMIDDSIVNLAKYPHFFFWMFFLIFWSGTFFFWAYIKILNEEHYPFLEYVLDFQVLLNLFVYTGIGLTLFFYPKKSIS